jgi:hypothetical protein
VSSEREKDAHGHFSEGQDKGPAHAPDKERVGHFSEGKREPTMPPPMDTSARARRRRRNTPTPRSTKAPSETSRRSLDPRSNK